MFGFRLMVLIILCMSLSISLLSAPRGHRWGDSSAKVVQLEKKKTGQEVFAKGGGEPDSNYRKEHFMNSFKMAGIEVQSLNFIFQEDRLAVVQYEFAISPRITRDPRKIIPHILRRKYGRRLRKMSLSEMRSIGFLNRLPHFWSFNRDSDIEWSDKQKRFVLTGPHRKDGMDPFSYQNMKKNYAVYRAGDSVIYIYKTSWQYRVTYCSLSIYRKYIKQLIVYAAKKTQDRKRKTDALTDQF